MSCSVTSNATCWGANPLAAMVRSMLAARCWSRSSAAERLIPMMNGPHSGCAAAHSAA